MVLSLNYTNYLREIRGFFTETRNLVTTVHVTFLKLNLEAQMPVAPHWWLPQLMSLDCWLEYSTGF